MNDTPGPDTFIVQRVSGRIQSIQRTLYVGLDIDSTVITHCYPGMDGEDIGAIPWLLAIQKDYPVAYLLNTMRSDHSLQLASDWLTEQGVNVVGSGINPTQQRWTNSPKCHCHAYIDDRAVGAPLRPDKCIDWVRFGPMLAELVRDIDAYLNPTFEEPHDDA